MDRPSPGWLSPSPWNRIYVLQEWLSPGAPVPMTSRPDFRQSVQIIINSAFRPYAKKWDNRPSFANQHSASIQYAPITRFVQLAFGVPTFGLHFCHISDIITLVHWGAIELSLDPPFRGTRLNIQLPQQGALPWGSMICLRALEGRSPRRSKRRENINIGATLIHRHVSEHRGEVHGCKRVIEIDGRNT